MRSLTPTKLKVASLAGLDSPGHAAAVAVDAESGGVYIAVETLVDEGGLEVEIVRINPDSASLSSPEVKFRSIESYTGTRLTLNRSSAPSRLPPWPPSHSHHVLQRPSTCITFPMIEVWSSSSPEGTSLPFNSKQLTVPLYVWLTPGSWRLINAVQIEVVGSVDSGIKAATWSPDEEVLVLITGEAVAVVLGPTLRGQVRINWFV